VYRRIREPRALPDGLKLRALEWALYFAVNGTHSAAELGRQLRVEPAERDEALTRLASLGLVDECEIDATEYVRALAAAGDRDEKTLREFLIGVARRQESPAVPSPSDGPETPAAIAQAPSAPLPPRPAPITPALTAPKAEGSPQPAPRPSPRFGFKPRPPPDDVVKENQPMSASRRLSLRALMNLIETEAGSREAGQLDIYRVFVRVDTSLLKRNGIETLRFTDDRLVSDPELEQALVRSVKRTLGLNCPDSVWVEVA
jgi:hypothetical protein